MGGPDCFQFDSSQESSPINPLRRRANSCAGSPRSGRLKTYEFACLTVLCTILCNARGSSAWGWLMAGNWSSTDFALPCNATYCVHLPLRNASMAIQLHRCVGIRFWEEQFVFDGSHFVMSTSEGVDSCLDVVEDGATVGLRDCDAMSQSQRWGFNGTKLQNGQGLFLMAPAPLAPYASDVPLMVGELDDTATSDWTFMDSECLGDSKPMLPSSRSANLVLNDQFLENWGEREADGSPGDMTLLCRWTILGYSTSVVRNTNWSGGWNVILGAISQKVATYPGLPHTLKFNLKVINGTCGGGDPAANKILVSLLPSSSESNMVNVDSNGGLWKAEELRFLAVDNTVNLTFARVGENSSCSFVIGNVEVGLEDDYLISEAADKLWTRVLYLYALVAFFGVLALAVSVAHVAGSLRSRKLK